MNQPPSNMRRLVGYTRYAVGPLVIGLIFTILSVGCDLFGPRLVAKILDGGIVAGVGPGDPDAFALMVGLYAGSVLLGLATRYLGDVVNQIAANRVARQMQRDVFAHVQRLPVQYFDTLAAGTVVSRVTNDTKAISVFFRTVLSRLLMAVIFAVGILLSLLLLDWRLFAIAAISFPILFFLIRDFRKKSLTFSRGVRRNISRLNANLNENIQGIEAIQAFNAERTRYDEFSRINDRVFRGGLGITHLHAYNGWNATDALNHLMLACVLLYYGLANLKGNAIVPIGHLYLFIDYMIRFFSQMNMIMQHLGNVERARGAADHVFELLDQPTVPEGGDVLDAVRGDVAFDHVTFAYKDDEHVLKDVSFGVPAGKTAAFVGETGAGKSTVMNLLFAFYPPDEGAVRIDGHDIRHLDPVELRKHMAIVTQEPFLFTGTVASNITLNRPTLTMEDAREALIEVGGAHFLARLPEGLETPVRERGNEFSAGERQLISFARALAQKPTILVLDEATANVDTETENIIQQGIERLSRGRTTLIIAHRLSTIRHADQIYVLDHGRIAERGTHEELIARDGLFAHMVETQTRLGQS
ncbi:MAG: ABC transporter ATP-binding protein [Saccharofermentanales bacterium]|jgi:ATP-binding cassette subfamily B multidrug efflux pump